MRTSKKYFNLCLFLTLLLCQSVGKADAQSSAAAQTMAKVAGLPSAAEWPAINAEAWPGTRWWWMGSAVDSANLTKNMEEYSAAGLRTVEITPIYGVKGNERNEKSFLSAPWMSMLRHVEAEAGRLGMQVDMNTGTGWPFGGPEVDVDDAACKMLVEEWRLGGERRRLEQPIMPRDERQRPTATLERLMAYGNGRCLDLTRRVRPDKTLDWKAPKGEWRLIAVFCGHTFQKVKRAAPGGEGLVMNHFSASAVSRYLSRFSRAFAATGTPWPSTFFNDSYEVYNADFTKGLFDEFLKRRGYKLEEHLPELFDDTESDLSRRIATDYRLVMAELLQESFTRQWTEWAHSHGSLTRNQAHGSPANLIDLYAEADIPEIEGFGLSDFGIRGLRRDSLTRPNFSDLSMLKYASSAAHISGKRLTSSETFTWLTEHFRTSLSQMKPDMDLMFVSGVNRMFFHGTTYSPCDAPWPGWKFYASVNMNSSDNIWRDAPAFFNYIARCQSFLQAGCPDNDFLLYLPVFDMWHEQPFSEGNRIVQFDIHKMPRIAPRFIAAVDSICGSGFDVDYISDSFVKTLRFDGSALTTSGGAHYKGIIVAGARLVPLDVLARLRDLARQGAAVIFIGAWPEGMPGLSATDGQRAEFAQVLADLRAMQGGNVRFGSGCRQTLLETGVEPERMVGEFGLKTIRRRNDDGWHYFVAALSPTGADGWTPLAVAARSAMLYDPMSGVVGKARLRQRNGRAEVYLQLASGESVIIRTFTDKDVDAPAWRYLEPAADTIRLNKPWGIRFLAAEPAVSGVPEQVSLGSWTEIAGASSVSETMATARYSATVTLTERDIDCADIVLDLGDVRESARVTVNGQAAGTLFAVPFRLSIGRLLHAGANTIEVDVTNLSANRIAGLDRRGVSWRNFKEINMVDLNYKKTPYSDWSPMPSGLLGPVCLVKMRGI